jgi:hypothetical protein
LENADTRRSRSSSFLGFAPAAAGIMLAAMRGDMRHFCMTPIESLRSETPSTCAAAASSEAPCCMSFVIAS